MTRILAIERMQLADIPKVMDIEIQSFSTPWSESAYITEASSQSAYYVVARLGDDVAGYAGMWMIMDEAHITTIAVDPKQRGRKFGERLLVALLDESIARGLRRATLEVRKSNRVARRLYEKYGFETVAVRRGYYADNKEDAMVMWVYDLLSPDYLSKYRELKSRLEGLPRGTTSEGADSETSQ